MTTSWTSAKSATSLFLMTILIVPALVADTPPKTDASIGPAAQTQPPSPAMALIPRPASMTLAEGTFALDARVRIAAKADARATAEFLRQELAQRLGAAPEAADPGAAGPAITLSIEAGGAPAAENYTLVVAADTVAITAPGEAGLFYGCQTLLQMVDARIASSGPKARCELPALRVEDRPRFAWRGFMLDEARHFFGKPTVLKLLDTMAYLKLNRFHWHLTDDRWRFEVKKYPKLTTAGAAGDLSNPDAPPAFYTQEEIREIVHYAAQRHIVVIPEIEMPGHARGATVAYPELAGGDASDPKWRLFTYNPASDAVRRFLGEVLDETVPLFPGPYLNMGGDETHFGNKAWANRPEVQALMKKENLPSLAAVEHRFMRQMAEEIVRRGKKVTGWEEVAKTGLAVEQVAPIWWHDDDLKGLADKIEKKYEVILCPHHPTYFDFVQAAEHHSGRKAGKGRLNSVAAVYEHPDTLRAKVPNLDRAAGLQAAAWSEQIHTPARLWFMIFPRLTALAESAWTPAARKDYADFTRRLPVHFAYLKRHEMGYYDPSDPKATPEVVGPARLYQPEWGGWVNQNKAP